MRRYVAGAIRFSQQNGFRLPHHWERFTAILGPLGDIRNADLTSFGIDGGLRFIGDFEFLQERLIGCTVEEFLNRPDVRYITSADSLEPFGLSDGDDDDDYDVAADEADEDFDIDAAMKDPQFNSLLGKVFSAATIQVAHEDIRSWCQESNLTPHPLLDEAAGIIAEALEKILTYQDDNDQPKLSFEGMIQRIIETKPAAMQEELKIAVEQFRQGLIGNTAARIAGYASKSEGMVDAEWSREVLPGTIPQADAEKRDS